MSILGKGSIFKLDPVWERCSLGEAVFGARLEAEVTMQRGFTWRRHRWGESGERKRRSLGAGGGLDPRHSQVITLRVRVNSSSAAIAGPEGGEVSGCKWCQEPGAFVSRCLVIRGEVVWTQCAMGDRGRVESCMTGPDQYNIGSERRAIGTAVQGVVEGTAGGRETVDAVVVLAQVLM